MLGNKALSFTGQKASFTVRKFQLLVPWVFAGKEGIGTEFFAINTKKRGLI